LKKMMQKDVHNLLRWPRGLLGLNSAQGVPMTFATRAFQLIVDDWILGGKTEKKTQEKPRNVALF